MASLPASPPGSRTGNDAEPDSKAQSEPCDSPISFHEAQRRFNSMIKRPVDPVKHEKTMVLLLYWANSKLKCQPEVSSLRTVFQERYGFEVIETPIQGNLPCRASREVKHAISELFYYCQSDVKHTLFIVYYAGHGWLRNDPYDPDEQDDYRIGCNTNQKAMNNPENNSVVWREVEAELRKEDADILVVFDSCYAGWLEGDRRAPQEYCFEYMGACNEKESAHGPDKPYSYTKALILAFEELAADDRGFSTATLHRLVVEKQHGLIAEHSVSEHEIEVLHPVNFHRDRNRNQSPVWIQPHRAMALSSQHHFREDTADGQGEWESWYIRLFFNQKQTEKNMGELGVSFNKLIEAHDHQGLRYVELFERPDDLRKVDKAIKVWRKQVRERKSETGLQKFVTQLPLPAAPSIASDSGVDLPSLMQDTPLATPTELAGLSGPPLGAVGTVGSSKKRTLDSDDEDALSLKRHRVNPP